MTEFGFLVVCILEVDLGLSHYPVKFKPVTFTPFFDLIEIPTGYIWLGSFLADLEADLNVLHLCKLGRISAVHVDKSICIFRVNAGVTVLSKLPAR